MVLTSEILNLFIVDKDRGEFVLRRHDSNLNTLDSLESGARLRLLIVSSVFHGILNPYF